MIISKQDPDKLLRNIRVRVGDLTPHVLVMGDPRRVQATAAFMTDVKEVGNHREFLTITGNYAGQRLTACSHGVGAGGANLCFMQLMEGGAQVMIRAGTCGSLDVDLNEGDLIVATGAVREDGATEHLMPLPYPAISDHGVVGALLEAATNQGVNDPRMGLIVTQANFYPTDVLPARFDKYVGYGVLGVEMELSALLVLAHMHGVRAGGIVTCDGNLVRQPDPKLSRYDPHREVVDKGTKIMLKSALEALAYLASMDAKVS